MKILKRLLKKSGTSIPQLFGFDVPLAPLPVPPNDFYFEELLSWMTNGFQNIYHEAVGLNDTIIKHKVFPPEPDSEEKGIAPIIYHDESMVTEELVFGEQPARKRFFKKSPALHVFLLTILETIRGNSNDFINYYARKKSIDKFLENDHKYEGELKCIRLLVQELEAYLKKDTIQLIPILYHFRGHGLVMTSDISLNAVDKIDVKTTPNYFWEFVFSKQTSDAFTMQLISILKDRESNISTIIDFHETDTNSKGDSRIECNLDKEGILNYFNRLSSSYDNGEQIMSAEDVKYFLHANFKVFHPKKKLKKFNPNINQANLKYFIYKFYSRYALYSQEAKIYAKLAKDNFTQFDNEELSTITGTFQHEPVKFPFFLKID